MLLRKWKIQPNRDTGYIRFELDTEEKRVRMLDAQDPRDRLNDLAAANDLRRLPGKVWYVTITHMTTHTHGHICIHVNSLPVSCASATGRKYRQKINSAS